MDNGDDQSLIEAVKKGDQQAFATLVHQYQQPIYNVVYRMLSDREEARDVTQTVFLKTFENMDSYNPARKFFSWICRIAINETINVQSRKKPDTRFDEELVAAADNGAGNNGPREALEQDELRAGLEAALMHLNSDHRSAVVLKHVVGMSYTDISATLEVSEKTVKARLYNARQKLRERLKKDVCQ